MQPAPVMQPVAIVQTAAIVQPAPVVQTAALRPRSSQVQRLLLKLGPRPEEGGEGVPMAVDEEPEVSSMPAG